MNRTVDRQKYSVKCLARDGVLQLKSEIESVRVNPVIMADESRSMMRVDRRHCPHCECFVSLKTYKTHRRLYYDVNRDSWHTSSDLHTTDTGFDDAADSSNSSPPRSLSPTELVRADTSEMEELEVSSHSPPHFSKIIEMHTVM